VFDLETSVDLTRLDDPLLALQNLRGLVVCDESHQRPALFPVLRILADRPQSPAQFLVLGSTSTMLRQQSAKDLAEWMHYHELGG
jgi:predicted AAA+ superfamily ATPase